MTNLTSTIAGASLVASLFGAPGNIHTTGVHTPRVVTTSNKGAYNIPSYEWERIERKIKAKLKIAGHRVEASLKALLADKRFTSEQRETLFGIAILSGACLLADENIVGISASYSEDGELLFSAASADKLSLTYVRVEYDVDENDVFLTLSRFQDRKPISNIYHRWTEVLPQIMSTTETNPVPSPVSYALPT